MGKSLIAEWPGELVERLNAIATEYSFPKGRIVKMKRMANTYLEISGLEDAIDYLAHVEAQEKERLKISQQRQQREDRKTRLTTQMAYDIGMHNLVMEIAAKRLTGKEYAEKRPNVGIKFDITSDRCLSLKPKLHSSPNGWTLGVLECELLESAYGIVKATGRELKAELRPDGTMWLKSWWKDLDKTEKLVSKLQNALHTIATNPGVYLEGAHHCCICGKALSDDASMSRGIGPECLKFGDAIIRLLHGEADCDRKGHSSPGAL